MNKFFETYKQIEKKHIDCIRIGFIAGIGVTLIILSLLSMRYLRNTEEAIFQQRAEFEGQAIANAQRTCLGRVEELGRTDNTFYVRCGK